MSEFKNLQEKELHAIRVAQKRSAWKDIRPWVEALSAERGEHARTQRAFDSYIEDKDREIKRLQRRIEDLEGKKRQDEIMAIFEESNDGHFEEMDLLLDAKIEREKAA